MSAFRSPRKRRAFMAAVCALTASMVAGHASAQLSDEVFFEEVPPVLTASRLAQSQADVPGAVTVFDRKTLARLGARDLADVLRFVPGYMVSGYNGAHPIGSYHAPLDKYGARSLILLDGRSLFSSTFLGGTFRGVSSIQLDDVERIEVLRGSNSAAYGAHALFGVINIVTRHAADSQSRSVKVTRGTEGLLDVHARVGWQADASHHRLSVSRRSDDGYATLEDSRTVDGLTWRGDWTFGALDTLRLDAGMTRLRADEGIVGNTGDPVRPIEWTNHYLNGAWKRSWSDADITRVEFSIDRDQTTDQYRFPGAGPFQGALIDQGSLERRTRLEVQHERVASDTLRWVVGLGLRHETARSVPLFGPVGQVGVQDRHLFGEVSWEFQKDWTLNTAWFAGHQDDVGTYVNPRVFINHRLDDHQSLRAGFSASQNNPTLFLNQGLRVVTAPSGLASVTLYRGTNNLQAEKLKSVEAGYFGRWNAVQLDVRLFHETFRDYLEIFNNVTQNFPQGFDVRGLEYELRWTPRPNVSLWLNQTFLDFDWRIPPSFFVGANSLVDRKPPQSMTGVALLWEFAPRWDFMAHLQARDAMAWRRTTNNLLEPTTRLDLRLAHSWPHRYGRASLAFQIQAANGRQDEYQITVPTVFPRRAYVTLHVDY